VAGLEGLRQTAAVILDDLPGLGQHVPSSLGDEEAEFAQESSERVDRADAIGEPSRAQAMKRGDHLLGDALDGHGPNLLVAKGLEQPVDVGAVRLVPHHVGPDVLRREQDDHVAQFLDAAGPEVGGAASLHHDSCLEQLREELEELVTGQSPAQSNTPGAIRDANLKDVLCDIDRDESIVLPGWAPPCSYPAPTLAHRCRSSRGRSPSHQ
jgi:hypothetical protein